MAPVFLKEEKIYYKMVTHYTLYLDSINRQKSRLKEFKQTKTDFSERAFALKGLSLWLSF